MEKDTIFPVCSMTKVITATCIMMLVEEGIISLNRSVSDYIPMFKGNGKEKICVHHLLTHTSGLRDDYLDEYCEEKIKQNTVEIPPCESNQDVYINKGIYLIQDMPVWQEPGKVMSYFSFGYGLLGEIIARVSGKSYPEFVRERLFEPLGMKDSYFSVPDVVKDRVVKRSAPSVFWEWLTSEGSL